MLNLYFLLKKTKPPFLVFFTLNLSKFYQNLRLTFTKFYQNQWKKKILVIQISHFVIKLKPKYQNKLVRKSFLDSLLFLTSTIFYRRTLREKCPYLDLFWSAFSRNRTEYREILHISPYSVRMWENRNQDNSDTDTFYALVGWVFCYF